VDSPKYSVCLLAPVQQAIHAARYLDPGTAGMILAKDIVKMPKVGGQTPSPIRQPTAVA